MPVAAAAARVAAPILKKRGLAEARIVTDWRAIVGDVAAQRSSPERLVRGRQTERGGTLRLRVAGAWALEFQHMAPELIQRINAYFGYPAVSRIQFIQAPLPAAKRASAPPPPLAPEAEARLAALAAKIDDPELRERVLSLGRALEQRATRAAASRGRNAAGPARKPV
ncbi:MAG TPA: DciA family protein [Alphaproteobacteria bacterium]